MIKTIKSISLKNFQSHKDTHVDLCSSVNILSGESNNGKTAILRAINWLLTNRPSGIGFVSTWAKETNSKGEQVINKGVQCEVTIVVEDTEGAEHTISRIKTKDDNLYVLDGVKLAAVGSSVPSEVTALLCLKDINTQSQDDGYFFLTLTPGQAAARLNELVHLDSIDDAYAFIHAKKTALNSVVKSWESSLAENKIKRDGLSYVPELEQDIFELSDKESRREELEEFIDTAQDLLNEVTNLQACLDKLVPNTCEQDILRITDLLDDYHQIEDTLNKEKQLLLKVQETEYELNHTTTITQEEIDELVKLVTEYTELTNSQIDMQNMLTTISMTTEEIEQITKELQEIKSQLPELCPTCNQPINKELL